MRYELRRLSPTALEGAIAKAEHYRDLNQPDEAESICRDVLDVDPKHQLALRTLGLALTDRLPRDRHHVFDEAVATFKQLTSAYEQAYYLGIAWERLAKVQLEHDEARNAISSFEKALALFDQAAALGPEGAPDPVLRWNRCVRALEAHPEIVAAQKPRAPAGFVYDD
jgi:tetratricopeptide (TPR) repeat protein